MTKRTNHTHTESQQALPFRRGRGGMWAHITPLEHRGIALAGSLVLLVSATYVYFMMSSVMHVAGRESFSIEGSKRSAEVARLESEYLRKTEAITEHFAHERGFIAVSSRSFVERIESVSLNNTQ